MGSLDFGTAVIEEISEIALKHLDSARRGADI